MPMPGKLEYFKTYLIIDIALKEKYQTLSLPELKEAIYYENDEGVLDSIHST